MVPSRCRDISEFKQSFIKSLINNVLRTVQVFNRLTLDPLLNEAEVVKFADLSFFFFKPGYKMREEVGVKVSYKNPINDMAKKHF